MQDDFGLTTVPPAGSPLHELLGERLEAPGQQHRNHMNMLIHNLTGVTSSSAGKQRLDGRPVRAHDELDHHGIGWRVGPAAVRSPGDPFTRSVERHQSWMSRPMAQIPARIEPVSVQPSVLLPSPTRSRP
jgi:hypothetical protein